MDSDDRQVGRILSRREFLALLGTTGAALLAGCMPQQITTEQPTLIATQKPTSTPAISPTEVPPLATSTLSAASLPACIVRPEQTEGPYFVDEMLYRSDIRSDPSDDSVREGLPLQLSFLVSQIGSGVCQPLAGASVDVWHCDAQGIYSDVSDPGFNSVGQKFLRGYQITDEKGMAQFTTIYPGWYQGRTVHIHFKIRTNPDSGPVYEFISQLFFDDSTSDQVYAQAPYVSKGERTLRNEGDNIYRAGGDQLLLQLTPAAQGYAAVFPIGLQMT